MLLKAEDDLKNEKEVKELSQGTLEEARKKFAELQESEIRLRGLYDGEQEKNEQLIVELKSKD